MRAYKERHYADWIDHPLPTLDGKTARATVRTKSGRAQVEVLLKDMENHEARLPAGERFDFSRIRVELGLSSRAPSSLDRGMHHASATADRRGT